VGTRDSESENTGPETLDPVYQYVWSARYIDAPVLRDENKNSDGDCTDAPGDERLYYLTDANMNVTCLVDTAGGALERYLYDPYGRMTVLDADWSLDADGKSDYANSILFCGYHRDDETGLYHVRYRMYHPLLGRWVQRDRLGYVDGMNFYEIATSRILRLLDPLGLAALELQVLESDPNDDHGTDISLTPIKTFGQDSWVSGNTASMEVWARGERRGTCSSNRSILMAKVDGNGGKVTLRVEVVGSHVSAEVSSKRSGSGKSHAEATVFYGKNRWEIEAIVSQDPTIGKTGLKDTAGKTAVIELKDFPCDGKWHDIAGTAVSGYVGPGLPADYTEGQSTLTVEVTIAP
jgi:RHS repeat-associated protein